MIEDATLRLRCQDKVWDYFTARMRAVLVRLLDAFMEYERDQMLGCDPYERTADRKGYRNGSHPRRLDTRWGEILVHRPKVRGASELFTTLVIECYQQRQRALEEAIVEWIAAGQSTREVRRSLAKIFGATLSATAISNVVAQLDLEIQQFHRRSLEHGYRYVYFDGKHGYTCHKRKRRGRGKKKKGVLLLAWGARHDGPEELIDFRVADGETLPSWTAFMTDLEARGLREQNRWGQRLEMIVSDGDSALLTSLYTVFPNVPKQRCIFHKIQDITDHLCERQNRKAMAVHPHRPPSWPAPAGSTKT